MDATPLLGKIARRLNDVHLEAVLIGNAGAALQGAPVIEIGGAPLVVASLSDIIASKRAARRPRDLAVLDILENARAAQTSKATRQARRARPRK